MFGIKGFSVFLLAIATSLIASENCPSKFKSHGMCDSIGTKSENELVLIDFAVFRPPLDSIDSPQAKAELREWTDSLFTKYTFRYMADSVTRVPVPHDSELSYVYKYLRLPKGSLFELAKESFVAWIEYEGVGPSTGIVIGRHRSGVIQNPSKSYDILGKHQSEASDVKTRSLKKPTYSR